MAQFFSNLWTMAQSLVIWMAFVEQIWKFVVSMPQLKSCIIT